MVKRFEFAVDLAKSDRLRANINIDNKRYYL